MVRLSSILTDVRRALDLLRPDASEDLLREIELRTNDEPSSRAPLLPRGRLLDEVAPAVREAFPDRAEAILLAIQTELWPHGVIGPLNALDPYRGAHPNEPLDEEPDSFPSLLVEWPSPGVGVGRGVRLLLHRDVMTLGRATFNDFAFSDDTLSRQHLRITLDARDQVFVEDMGSANGLLVNGNRLHETWVSNSDVIGCGRVRLRFIGPRH